MKKIERFFFFFLFVSFSLLLSPVQKKKRKTLTRPERQVNEPVGPQLPQPFEPPRPQVLAQLESKARRRVRPLWRLRRQVEARSGFQQQEGLVSVVSRAAELEENTLLWWRTWFLVVVVEVRVRERASEDEEEG